MKRMYLNLYVTRPRLAHVTHLLTLLVLLCSISLLTSQAQAQTGQALAFDGTDDYVQVPAGTYFSGGNLTIEAWVYPRSVNNYARIIDFGNGEYKQNVYLSLSTGNQGKPRFFIGDSENDNPVLSASQELPLNQWSHVAATMSGTTATIYINGVAAGQQTFTKAPVNIVRSICYIGRSNWSGDAYANAIIDEVRIWNVARTATQIAQNKDCELKGTETGLVAYYNFNQGTAGSDNTGVTSLTSAVSSVSSGTLGNFTGSGTTSNFVAPGGAVKCVNCNTFVTRTTANGLGSNSVYDVFAIGNTVYAATAGGLSISTDGGQTFTNKVINGSVTAANVYVTGNSIYTSAGSRLSRSTDGGQTFTTINSPNAPFSSVFVQGNTIIATIGGSGSNSGSYVLSSDEGSSFATKSINGIATGKGSANGIFGANGKLYVAANSGRAMGLYVSTDNGNTFTLSSSVGTIDMFAGYAVNNLVYLATQTGLFISSNGGQTFTQRTTANGLGSNVVNDVYAVGNRIYAATGNGLSISNDGGQTFTNYTTANGLSNNWVSAVFAVGTTTYAATSTGLSVANFQVQTSTTRTTALGTTTTTTVVPTITIAPGQSAVLTAATNTAYTWSNGSGQSAGSTQAITVNTSDLFSVTATGDCPGTASVRVTVLQSGAGTTTTQTPLSATNCPVKLTATNLTGQRFLGTGPSGYVFNDAYPSPVSGKEITLTNIRQSGTYTIQSINASGVTTAVNTFNVTGSGCN